jgi:glycosyltransferase involved in cell wall biosynthesis
MNANLPKPIVSIGMPVYNGAAFIRQALDSLLSQTFIYFELIISDNASTDATETICLEYAKTDARIRYIRQPINIGIIENFRFVLNAASSEYFMWAAADDRRDPFFLKHAITVLESDPNVGLVFCDMITINLLNGDNHYYTVGYTGATQKWKKYLFRLSNNCPSLIYGLHRRSILQNFEIRQYDYMDIHLSHWYELNTVVKTIPLYLYTAGTNGARIPYSLTGPLVSSRNFLKREWALLRKHFSLTMSVILFCIVSYHFISNDKYVNSIIKKAVHKPTSRKSDEIIKKH